MTWQQILAKESPQNVMPAFREYYSSVRKLVDSNGDVLVYDCHDGKMLYILTQHSLWNRTGHPFILCKCRRGDCVKDPDHPCQIIDDQERLKLYETSKLKYEQVMMMNTNYSRKSHRKWCDVSNFGITHFGVHPSDLNRGNIRFDVFHMRSAICRKLLNKLRHFMRKQTFELQNEFDNILGTIWSTYYLHFWTSNKALSVLEGKHVVAFLMLVPQVVEFIRENFVVDDYLQTLCESFTLYSSISHFLCRTVIIKNDSSDAVKLIEKQEYERDIDIFKREVKELYALGAKSFLSEKNIGDCETFYCHVLFGYMPKIVEDTWQKFGLGCGIFNMQGFERRNKESKQIFTKFINGKGNVVMQSLKRLYKKFDS